MKKDTWLRIVGALFGAGLLTWFFAHTDRSALRAALASRAQLLPLCLAFELLRVLAETQATRSVLGSAARAVSFRRMYAVHLVGYAFSAVLPAPRPIAEAAKASLLAKPIGLGRCVNTGTLIQACTFLAVGMGSAICALFTPAPTLRMLLVLNAVFVGSLGLGLAALVRSPKMHAFLARRWPSRAAFWDAFRTAAGGAKIGRPALWLLVSVLLQTALFGLLLRGIGTAPFVQGAATAEGAHVVTASVGVLVPGQMGVREMAFAEIAEHLGTSVAAAGALSLLPRLAQLAVAAAGFVTLAFLRESRKPSVLDS